MHLITQKKSPLYWHSVFQLCILVKENRFSRSGVKRIKRFSAPLFFILISLEQKESCLPSCALLSEFHSATKRCMCCTIYRLPFRVLYHRSRIRYSFWLLPITQRSFLHWGCSRHISQSVLRSETFKFFILLTLLVLIARTATYGNHKCNSFVRPGYQKQLNY